MIKSKEQIQYENYVLQRPLTPKPLIRVDVLRQSTGVGKSTIFRKTAVNIQNHTKHEGVTGIGVDRHDLSTEQLDKFYEEHPGTALVARIWRGRGAWDPEQPGKLMCWRNDEAEEVSAHGFSVERSLCKQEKDDGEVSCCPFFDQCGYQRQKQPAHIWFFAHEVLLHAVPEVFGEVGLVMIDEDPLDAFFFGIERVYEVPLDAVTKAPLIDDSEERQKLMRARLQLHEALIQLPEGPVPLRLLRNFPGNALDMSRLEWKGKIDVEILPNWNKGQVKAALAAAAHNKVVIRLAKLWELVDQGSKPRTVVTPIGSSAPEPFSGCIEIARNDAGVRMIRMKGIKEPATGWQRPTLIGSATLDAELMKKVWVPAVRDDSWGGYSGIWNFNELPCSIVARPKHVIVRQTIDASFSKKWSLPSDPAKLAERAREMLAMTLREAVQFAPQRSLMICHMATQLVIAPESVLLDAEESIECADDDPSDVDEASGVPTGDVPTDTAFHVPPWLELAHHGAITGLDKWKNVRAQFVFGRPMPSAQLITQQAEAICGEYIASRNYVRREVPIHIVPDADGHTCIYVDQFEHPHPLAQRLLRRVVWGGVLQEIGRTRYVSRERNDPLDIWLMNTVPMGMEVGYVVPVQWGSDETDLPSVGPTLDDLMLTTGCWLENTADAKLANDGLITSPNALRLERSRTNSAAPYLKLIAGGSVDGGFQVVVYRRDVPKTKKTHAIFLAGLTDDPKAWLEERLGKLAIFETL